MLFLNQNMHLLEENDKNEDYTAISSQNIPRLDAFHASAPSGIHVLPPISKIECTVCIQTAFYGLNGLSSIYSTPAILRISAGVDTMWSAYALRKCDTGLNPHVTPTDSVPARRAVSMSTAESPT